MRKIRILSLVMALCLVAALLVSCGPKQQEIDLQEDIIRGLSLKLKELTEKK